MTYVAKNVLQYTIANYQRHGQCGDGYSRTFRTHEDEREVDETSGKADFLVSGSEYQKVFEHSGRS